MEIMTISKLPQIETTLKAQPMVFPENFNQSKMEVSFLSTCENENKYSSNSIELSTLNEFFTNKISSYCNTTYGLTTNQNKPLNVNKQFEKFANFDADDIEFKNFPKVKKEIDNLSVDEMLTTKKYVDNQVNSFQIKPFNKDSKFDVAQTIFNKKNSQTEDTEKEFISLKLTNASIDKFPYGASTYDKNTEGYQIEKSGNLILYGWVTPLNDSFNGIKPGNAWIALEGFICDNWIILQLQPYILGKYGTTLQYVGFNLPVSKNLKIRITTGFLIDFKTSGMQLDSNNLIYNQDDSTSSNKENSGTYTPNTFIGYII